MILKRLSTIALVTIAIVLATTTVTLADSSHGGRGAGFAGHPGAPFHGQPGFRGQFPGHRAFDGHRFDRRHFDHRFHGGAVVVAPFFWSYSPYPAYTYEPPASSYWYYCPSYGAYYPTVQTCPEPWVTVPG